MKTLTIDLDEEMSAFVRQDAAKLGISVDQYMSELVHACMREAYAYEAARQAFLACKPFHFEFDDGRRPTRDEIYDRACLR